MTSIQATAIVRDRGQLTIPGKLRKALKWPSTNMVVLIKTTSIDEIIIKAYEPSKKLKWESIWREIRKTRSHKGRKGNLSKFVMSDRENH